jgi:hypothetical protein
LLRRIQLLNDAAIKRLVFGCLYVNYLLLTGLKEDISQCTTLGELYINNRFSISAIDDNNLITPNF